MARYSEELMPAPNYRGKHLPNLSGVENLIPGGKKHTKKAVGISKQRNLLLGLILERILPHFPSVGILNAALLLLSGQPTEGKDKKVCTTFSISVFHSKTFMSETLKIHREREKKTHTDPHRNAWTVGSGISLCAFIWYQQSQRHLGTPDGAAILQLFSISYLLAVRLHTFLPRV